jgi:uncharacterized protein YacL
MSWLSSLPVLLALPIWAALFAAVAVLAHTVMRRFLPSPERLSEHHEVAGFLVGVVGVLYSVVLGFLVGTVWTAFASAQQTVDLEAGYVADAFNFAGQMPLPQRAALQRVIAQYAIADRIEDWSSAAPPSGPSTRLLSEAVRLTVAVPSSPGSASSAQVAELDRIRSTLLDTLRNIGDTRRLRFVQSRSHLPQGLLEALLLGAAAVMAFTFLFGVRSYLKQMTMTALLAGSIGLFFGLVVELSTPYSGPIHVSRDSFDLVISNNHMMQFSK